MTTEEERRQRHKEYCRAYYAAHREEMKAKAREHHWANAERERERSRAYYAEHRERLRAQQAEHARKNRAKISAQQKARYAVHKDEYNARQRELYHENIDREREKAKRYYRNHAEVVKAKQRKRRKIERLKRDGVADAQARLIVWSDGFDLEAELGEIWKDWAMKAKERRRFGDT